MVEEKTRELLAHGYPPNIASDMNNDNIARCDVEIAEKRSPKHLKEAAADLAAQWVD
jgi:hypothetical protein